MDEYNKPAIMICVSEHFSKSTDADCRIVWEDVKGYGFEDAERAITEHRREKGAQAWRPDPRRIKSLAASYYRERQRTRWNAVRTVDHLRRENPSAELLAGLPDLEAIEAHFTHAWGLVEHESEPDSIGRNAARAFILLGARHVFEEIGVERAEADRRARECVDLMPGEKIPHRALFKPLPGPPPTSWEARKQLAIAEHNQPVTA